MEKKYKLGIIGAGFMAQAIVSGLQLSNAKKLIVSDSNIAALEKFKANKINKTTDNLEVFNNSEFILLAIKPQTFYENFQTFKNFSPKKVISIMAGVTKENIKNVFVGSSVARVMPNAPISVGCGMSALDTLDFDDRDRNFIYKLFSKSGEILEISENKMDAVTAISGSGPAYVYKFIESLANSGESLGLSKKDALTLSLNTVLGGAVMAKESNMPLKDLIAAVCSKGGTTIEAIKSLDNDNFDTIIKRAASASAKRAAELSKK